MHRELRLAQRGIATGIVLPALLAAALPGSAAAGTVQQVTSFGSNPSGIGMYVYTPANLAAKPAIFVGVHACHGKGTDVCQSGSAFGQQADKWGFLLVCPSAISSDGCWDVHSTADLTHNGGGDGAGIVSMVDYVVQNLNGDVNRVFVAGHSSGGMMTNVMLGSYPDVFKAGAAFAGVPFACYAQGSVDSLGWNTSCATGKVTMTGAQWGDLVRAAYPGFTARRPRMQLWHGTTDDTVSFVNFGEEIKQWTNVLGVGETPTSTENNALQSTWIRTRYADAAGVVQVEAIQETGQPHNLVVNIAEAVRFFGLDGSNPVPDAGPKDSSGDTRSSAGGAAASGGGTGSAGSSGTGGVTGGNTGRGGTGGADGGSTAAGGSGSGSGGNTGSGGKPTDAGPSSDGALAAWGGATGGASTSTGGTTAGGGGKVGSGGATATGLGGSTGQASNPSGSSPRGCSCDVGGGVSVQATHAAWVGCLALLLGLSRRRRQR